MWKHPKRVRFIALAVVWCAMMAVIVLVQPPMMKYAMVPLLFLIAGGAVVWESARADASDHVREALEVNQRAVKQFRLMAGSMSLALREQADKMICPQEVSDRLNDIADMCDRVGVA